jgi:hypothetical protein
MRRLNLKFLLLINFPKSISKKQQFDENANVVFSARNILKHTDGF